MEIPNDPVFTTPPTQLAVGAKKWYGHKGVIAVIILAVIAGVAAWSYYFLGQPKNVKPALTDQSALRNQQQNPQPSSGTLTYTNSILNFSFSYPEEFTLEDDSRPDFLGIWLSDKNDPKAAITVSNVDLAGKSLEEYVSQSTVASPSAKQNVTINGNSGIIFTFTGANGDFKEFIFTHGNITYRIMARNPGLSGDAFDLIVQSFQFKK